jgi:hypothetical protein
MDAERKILRVLDVIKAHWDLSPKNGYREKSGAYSYAHPPGELTLAMRTLVSEAKVEYEELNPILHKLEEEGLLKSVRRYNDFE